MAASAGSNFSVVNGLDGTTKVPISTPVNDSSGNTVVAHLGMTVASGVATPISATNPVPVAFAATQSVSQSGTWNVGITGTPTVSVNGTVPVSAAALPLPAGAAQDGTDATGVTAPAGGAGIRGWLSGIYGRLGGTLTVAFAAAQSVTQSGAWSVGITGTPTVNVNGTLPVSAASLPLPGGAATAANQPALHADGGALAHVTNLPATQAVTWSGLTVGATQSGTWTVGISGTPTVNVSGTVPVSAAALPLPTGAATAANQPALHADGGGLAHVTDLPATQAVSWSGQTVAATQSGTWSVSVVGGNASAVKVDGSAATQPVSAAALPLPAGAATAAKQHGFGAAGTPNADVVTVQGVSGGTALVVAGGGAVGAAPVNPPVSVAGIDASGNKQHMLLDTAGRQLVVQGGGSGTDYSANSGAAAATAGNLLVTVPVTAARAFVEVQNQSAGTISLVRDDGAGNNQTLILLAPGSGAGSQGGGWSSATFKGRVRVYGAAGAQVAAYQE